MQMKCLTTWMFAILTVLLYFTGCQKNDSNATDAKSDRLTLSTSASNSNLDATKHLLNVYTPTTYPMPEGFELNERVTPYYEAETDTLVCVGQRVTEDGAEYRLVTTRGDAGVAEEKPVPLSVDGEYVYMDYGFVTEDAVWFIARQYVEEKQETLYWLIRYFRADGTVEISPELNTLAGIGGAMAQVRGFAMDADGDLYVYENLKAHAVFVLGSDFSLRCKVPASGGGTSLNGIFTRPDGSVWCFGQIEGQRSAARIDKESLTLADPVRLLTSASGSNQQLVRYAADDALLYETSEGVFCSTGDGEGEMLMSFLNSNLMVDKSVFLCAANRDELLYSNENGCPVMWRSAGDIDLTTVRVLDVAITANLSAALTTKVIEFNRDHPDVRLVVKDYVNLTRNGGQTWDDPAQNLAMDIALGRYRPDMILGKTGGADMNYCLREKIYTDLTPYLDSDPVVNRDNVLGAVLRAFDDGEGGLWGLADNFTISTLVSPDSILPAEYRDGWTLDDLLDFADSLPSDVTLIEGLTRETAADKLLGANGYAAFIDWDSMTCSYDSPTFLRWLDFVRSLPKDEAELLRSSELEQLSDQEKYEYYWNGKVALRNMRFSSVEAILGAVFRFDTYDVSFPGYPTAGGTLSTDFAFLVTSFSDTTDEAWEFMTSVITEREGWETAEWRMFGGMSVLKSMFDEISVNEMNYTFKYMFSGGEGSTRKDLDNAYKLDSPGKVYDLTKADTDRIRDYYDNIAGSPIKADLPDDVAAILNEELSALIADAATPEACARNIQSRVSIWLAEHK